jgi:hypothetical protein
MAEDQILLLPKNKYFDWVTAARGYVLAFGVNLTPDPAVAGRAAVVTAPNGAGLFAVGDLTTWFRQNAPNARLDLVQATTPGEFSDALLNRSENHDRYGAASKPFTLAWPTDYNQILQPFGVNPEYYRRWGLPGHEGVDIRAPLRSNIYACADGTVAEVNDGSGNHPYGIHIRINHRDGFQTTYAYLSEALVNVGDTVTTRQLIAKAGSTGNASEPELHLGLKKQGATAAGLTNFPKDIIDPTPYLVIPPGWVPGPEVDYHWPPNKCLVGVHCRADGNMADADYTAIRQARVEAVKLMTISGSEDVDRVRQINANMFMIVRMHADFTNRVVKSADFANWMEGDMLPFYNKGLRYFEVHNEPNLTQEGWRQSWQDGREFGAWFLDVVGRLKARFPEAKFGYPGLSPGGDVGGIRMNSNGFLAGSEDAVGRADWIGAHCYWVNEASMNMTAAGRSWEDVRRRFPDKLIFITEFSNPNDAQDARTKGQQYVRYYQSLRNEPGIGAAFSFVLSASSGFSQEAWRLEDGRVTDIPREVGSRAF